MLIGTAGHIDHGKTTLIRALTGVNTDRLPEEQRRGISIDLGYAYLPTGDGSSIGFIDVPGHERFVPTMLAGATGIDTALLAVAADDGPMPQTREHLDILRLLGVGELLVALTKIDRASPEQVAAAKTALATLLAGTPYVDAPVCPVAATSGIGVDELRVRLLEKAARSRPHDHAPVFRLAIDRSFAIAGAGTVLTGTIHAGRVAVGDSVQLAKKSDGRRLDVRVRSLHANNRPATEAAFGMRCAINLAGISHQDAERGDWIVSPTMRAASHHLDIELLPLAHGEKLLRPGITLHVHHGTQHLMGRLVPLDEDNHLYQLVVATPLAAAHGDRLVLRDASGQRTIAGAVVIDPGAPQRHRRAAERLAQLTALRVSDPAQRLAGLIEASPDGVDLAGFEASHNVVVAPPADSVILGEQRWALSPTSLAALAARVGEALANHHERSPDELGLERDRLRRMAAPKLELKLFSALLARWKDAGLIAQHGAAWHLPAHRVELTASESRLAANVLAILSEAAYEPPWVRDLAAHLDIDETRLRALLCKLAARGDTFQVVRDLFFHRDAVARLVVDFRTLALAKGEPQPVKAAAFRDRIGLGRKRAIQILEFFDRVGFTRRIGAGQTQAHSIRGDAPTTGEDPDNMH